MNATAYALAKGWRVTATGRRGEVLAKLEKQGARTYLTDLETAPAQVLRGLMDLQGVVWHCAALAAPWGPRDAFMSANVEMPEKLFLAAARAGVPTFVHISSPAQYFDFENNFRVHESYRAPRFASMYAESKALGEDKLRELAKQHPQTKLVILRPRVMFGPHDQVLFPLMLEMVRRQGGGLVEAMALASQVDVPSGSVFNISNGEAVELRQALTQFFDARGLAIQVLSVPYPLLAGAAFVAEQVAKITGKAPFLTRHTVGGLSFGMTLDITAAQQVLGYTPQVSLQEGLARTARWFSHQD